MQQQESKHIDWSRDSMSKLNLEEEESKRVLWGFFAYTIYSSAMKEERTKCEDSCV